ncbi:MAG TPA: hypothetical protein VF017_12655 [Thermoanaerobaculia bacterium]|nr:hypothetical protein [Thermoanaerobaculia bacterium]
MRALHCLVLSGLATLLLVVPASIEAGEEPSFYHRYIMKGSILEVEEGAVYLCIGTSDGAVPGQVLEVVRITRKPGYNPKAGGLRFRRDKVGQVKIDEVVDEHFARASLLAGEAKAGDVVELSRPAG